MPPLRDGRKTVTAAGTAERLTTTSTAILSVTITAETDNGAIVVVGGSTVVAALATRRGTPLVAGDSLTLTRMGDGVDDLSHVYIDAITNGDGVTFTYAVPA